MQVREDVASPATQAERDKLETKQAHREKMRAVYDKYELALFQDPPLSPQELDEAGKEFIFEMARLADEWRKGSGWIGPAKF